MGYVLLWLENLAVTLLLLATLVACLGRWQRPRLRVALPIIAALVILAAYAGLTGLVGYLKFGTGLASFWFYPVVALTASYLVGAGWILIAGLRRGQAGLSGPQLRNLAEGRAGRRPGRGGGDTPDDRLEPGPGDAAATGDTPG